MQAKNKTSTTTCNRNWITALLTWHRRSHLSSKRFTWRLIRLRTSASRKERSLLARLLRRSVRKRLGHQLLPDLIRKSQLKPRSRIWIRTIWHRLEKWTSATRWKVAKNQELGQEPGHFQDHYQGHCQNRARVWVGNMNDQSKKSTPWGSSTNRNRRPRRGAPTRNHQSQMKNCNTSRSNK